MSILTCSRPDPSSKMGSSAVAVSSSVCIFPVTTPSFPRTGLRQLPPRYRPKVGTSPAEQGARSPHPPQVGIQFHDGGACGKWASSTLDSARAVSPSSLSSSCCCLPAQCVSPGPLHYAPLRSKQTSPEHPLAASVALSPTASSTAASAASRDATAVWACACAPRARARQCKKTEVSRAGVLVKNVGD